MRLRASPVGSMIMVTFFVVLIPYRDSSPKLTQSFAELPYCVTGGKSGTTGAAYLNGIVGSGTLASCEGHDGGYREDAEEMVATGTPAVAG